MKYPSILAPAAMVLAVALGVPAAFAQSNPTPAVMTDVAPLPAQDRQSIGAVVLEDSMVLAQREAFRQAGERTGLSSIGRNALRATLRQQTKSELAEMRALEAARFRDRGASTLDER